MRARILKPTSENIKLAGEIIRRGEVVGMPTETVYGLAGDVFNEKALTKIFSIKERPTFDPLIIHVAIPGESSQQGFLDLLEKLKLIQVSLLTSKAQSVAEKILNAFWPGPLTLVLPKDPRVPDLATSGLPTVAIRMPRHSVAQALIKAAGTPLAAPSANRFGRISPTIAQDVASELGDRIDLILDGGPCKVGLESTVLSVHSHGELQLLRPGGASLEKISEIVDTPIQISSTPTSAQLSSPGMLESHYAPQKTLHLFNARLSELSSKEKENLKIKVSGYRHLGLLLRNGAPEKAEVLLSQLTGKKVTVRSLSLTGDIEESARRLFSELRSLDHSEAEILFAEPWPDLKGLGYAISDRLKRSSTTKK